MLYSNGTKKDGNWKENEFIIESSSEAKPPVINWIKPELLASGSANPTANIKLGIKSPSRLIKIQISVNGKVVYENSTADKAPAGSDCDFLLEKSISLSEGDNVLKALVTNANGSSSSEVRTISFTPCFAISLACFTTFSIVSLLLMPRAKGMVQ